MLFINPAEHIQQLFKGRQIYQVCIHEIINILMQLIKQDRRGSIASAQGQRSSGANQGRRGSIDAQSVSSSVASNDKRAEETLFFSQDDSRLKFVLRQLSTLDFGASASDMVESGSDPGLSEYDEITGDGADRLRATWRLIEKIVIRRLYKINHVLLVHQAISIPFYHLVLLFEYVQLMFFIFYKVPIYNDFGTPLEALQNSNSANATSSTMGEPIRLDQVFAFVNFQVYALKDSSGGTFLILYAILSVIFLIFLVLLFGLADSLFEGSKRLELKDETKILLKIVSVMMTLYLFLLQIPFMVLLLQGYQCEEDAGEQFGITDIECNSTTHGLMCLFSTVSLIFYTAFLITQQYLFTMNDFESPLPWASFEKVLQLVRCSYKLLLTASFVFDKAGNHRAETGLACFFISVYTCTQRLHGSILFHKSIQLATVFYETLAAWLFISISLHVATGADLCIMEFLIIIACSISSSLLLLHWQELKRKQLLLMNHPKPAEISQWKNYFFRLHKLIESKQPGSLALVLGIIWDHFNECEDSNCSCQIAIESFDRLRQYKAMKEEFIAEDKAQQGQHQASIREMTISEKSTLPKMQTVMQNDDKISSGLPPSEGSRIQPQIVGGTPLDFLTIVRTKPYATRMRKNSVFMRAASKLNLLEKIESHVSFRDDLGRSQSLYRSSTQVQLDNQEMRNIEILSFHEEREGSLGYDLPYLKRQIYRFYAQLVKDVSQNLPENIALRIIGAEVYLKKLKNEFKAIFELMSCDLYTPSIYDRFIIFRKKLDIEQILYSNYQRMNQKQGFIDVNQVFRHSQLYLKYQLHEYLTVMAAQGFWRELLGRHINAQNLQKKGKDISTNMSKLTDILNKLQDIYPEDIKLLCRHGFFLINIANNESDALSLFEKAQGILQMKFIKKKQAATEELIFGENTATTIVIISATASSLGRIIDVNEELQNLLGFSRMEVVGKKIETIIPVPIAKKHDMLIQRYFETARPTVIEIQRQIFAQNKQGHLALVHLLAKVYPHLTNQIVFVGFIQKGTKFDAIPPPKQDLEHLDQSYIMTDEYGNISNVSQHLTTECGLNPKFFYDNGSAFQIKVNISQLFPDLHSHAVHDALTYSEGSSITLDTRQLLNYVDLEMLSSDEILEAKSCLGMYKCYLQFKELVIDPKFCKINIYRVIVVARLNEQIVNAYNFRPSSSDSHNDESSSFNSSLDDQTESGFDQSKDHQNNRISVGEPVDPQFEMGSVASSQASQASISSVVKDFKRTLSEKGTPRNVIILNRLLLIFLISAIVLQFIDYFLMRINKTAVDQKSEEYLMSEKRGIYQSMLAVNSRSLINIANGLESGDFDIQQMNGVLDRFEYLKLSVQKQANKLQDIHEELIKRRVTSDASRTEQSQFEMRPVELYRMDKQGRVSRYYQPYRIAFNAYLNEIQALDQANREQVNFKNKKLLGISPQDGLSILEGNHTNLLEQQAFFIISNSLRTLRTRSIEATENERRSAFDQFSTVPFLAIMIIAIMTTLFCLFFLMFYLWQIERLQAEILSLYAHLHLIDVQLVFKRCNNYFHELNNGTLIKHLLEHCNDSALAASQPQDAEANEPQPRKSGIKSVKLGLINSESGASPAGRGSVILQRLKTNNTGSSRIQKGFAYRSSNTERILDGSQVSEEEKEEFYLRKYIKQKQQQRFIKDKNGATNQFREVEDVTGRDFYKDIINSSFEYLRDLQEFEEHTRNAATARPQTVLNFTKQFQAKLEKTYLKNSSIFTPKAGGVKKLGNNPIKKIAGILRQNVAVAKKNFNSTRKSLNESKKFVDSPASFGSAIKQLKSAAAVSDAPRRTSIATLKFQAIIMRLGHEKAQEKQQVKLAPENEIVEESKDEDESDSSIAGLAAKNGETIEKQEDTSNSSEDEEDETKSRDTDFKQIMQQNTHEKKKLQTLKDHSEAQKQFTPEVQNHDINCPKLTDEEIHQRKKSFFKTIKVQNWGSKFSILSTALLFCAYFLQLYIYHYQYTDALSTYLDAMPIFYNRFHYLMLAYSMMRERIILNNDMQSFEKDPDYGYNIDYLYLDLSTQVEQELLHMPKGAQNINTQVLDFNTASDSKQLCTLLKDQFALQVSLDLVPIPILDQSYLQNVGTLYQYEINTVIKACKAAMAADVATLQQLQNTGIDINIGNYDGQTPLHMAAMFGKVEAVSYLSGISGIKLNSKDRWGATPYDYANREIKAILLAKGGIKTNTTSPIGSYNIQQQLTDDEARLFYAAKDGDLRAITGLYSIIKRAIQIDINGRTPLHIAASEGKREASLLLIQLGGVFVPSDNRGSTPIQEATSQTLKDSLINLVSNTLFSSSFTSFADGIFAQGLHSAIASYHKKFQDLQIRVDKATSYQERLSLLFSSDDPSPLLHTLHSYFQSLELYLHILLSRLDTSLDSTLSESTLSYSQNTNAIFIVALLVYIVILMLFRRQVIAQISEETFQSRGILNLIPNSFFEKNKAIVQGLITKIQQ